MEPSSDKQNKKAGKPMVYGLPKHRDKVINAISEAFANNDLDIEEYEKRLELAHDAKSIEALRQAVYDFPQINSLLPAPRKSNTSTVQSKQPHFSPSTRPDYAPSPAETFRRSFQEIDFINILGDKKITGIDIIKPNLKIITGIGDTTVDLRDVSHKYTNIQIENFSAIGTLRIRLPHHAQVSNKMFVLIGDSKKRQIGKSFLKKIFGFGSSPSMNYDPEQTPIFVEITGVKLIGDLIIEYMPEPGTTPFY